MHEFLGAVASVFFWHTHFVAVEVVAGPLEFGHGHERLEGLQELRAEGVDRLELFCVEGALAHAVGQPDVVVQTLGRREQPYPCALTVGTLRVDEQPAFLAEHVANVAGLELCAPPRVRPRRVASACAARVRAAVRFLPIPWTTAPRQRRRAR